MVDAPALCKIILFMTRNSYNNAATHLPNGRTEQFELRLSTAVRKGSVANSTLVCRLQGTKKIYLLVP